MSKEESRLLRTRQAAAYLAISAWQLRRLVQSGQVPIIQLAENAPWLYDKRDLDQFVEAHKQVM